MNQAKQITDFHAVEDQARDWLVLIGTGGATAQERRQFDSWLSADPAHQQAYRQVQKLWQDLESWSDLADLEPLYQLTLRERLGLVLDNMANLLPRPAWLAGGAVAIALFAVAVLLNTNLFSSALTEEYSTKVAQVREIELPDGSQMTLGAKSRVSLTYTDNARRVTLSGGEAFFDVAKDPERPFEVASGDALVQVLGTQFNLRYNSEKVRVDVLEGAVQVSKATPSGLLAIFDKSDKTENTRVLTAGQQITVEAGKIMAAVSDVGVGQIGAWRKGRLLYYDASLADVVSDANRYYQGEIIIADPVLSELRLTTAFPAAEVETLFDTLEDAFPIRVDRNFPGRIVLSSAR